MSVMVRKKKVTGARRTRSKSAKVLETVLRNFLNLYKTLENLPSLLKWLMFFSIALAGLYAILTTVGLLTGKSLKLKFLIDVELELSKLDRELLKLVREAYGRNSQS